MHACASPFYTVTLPARHPFPMAKYRLVRERLLGEGTLSPRCLIEPPQAPAELLALVHTADYLDRLLTGRLTRQEEVRTGFPWSPAIVARARHAAQGTLMAARIALREGLAANLAGGSHHAFPDHGEGRSQRFHLLHPRGAQLPLPKNLWQLGRGLPGPLRRAAPRRGGLRSGHRFLRVGG